MLRIPFRDEEDLISEENQAVGTETQYKEECFLRGLMKREDSNEDIIRSLIDEHADPSILKKLRKLLNKKDQSQKKFDPDAYNVGHIFGDDPEEEIQGCNYPDALPYSKLTNCQKKPVYDVVRMMARGEQTLSFVCGEGGTGKTVCVKTVVSAMRNAGYKVGVTATSGAAACLLRGSTMHSFLGVSIDLDVDNVRDERKEALSNLDFLVIDEISLAPGSWLDAVDDILRDAKGKPTVPFGGVSVMLVGDLCQLPPVPDKRKNRHSTRPSDGNKKPLPLACVAAWKTDLFKQFKPYVLTENRRQASGDDLLNILQTIRLGRPLGPHQWHILSKRLITYEHMIELTAEQKCVTIAARLQDIATINNRCLPEPTFVSNAMDVDGLGKPLAETYGGRSVEKLTGPPDRVIASVGCPMMVLRNIDTPSGIVNGMRGICTAVYEDSKMIRLQRLSPAPDGCEDDVYIRPMPFRIPPIEGVIVPGGARRVQLPCKVCYATTCHKFQGQTTDSCCVLLDNMNDQCGMLYTALSRVKILDGLYLTHSPALAPMTRKRFNRLIRCEGAVLDRLEEMVDATANRDSVPEDADLVGILREGQLNRVRMLATCLCVAACICARAESSAEKPHQNDTNKPYMAGRHAICQRWEETRCEYVQHTCSWQCKKNLI